MLGMDEGSSLRSTSRQEAIGMEIGKQWIRRWDCCKVAM
jgi:hypothetical protein